MKKQILICFIIVLFSCETFAQYITNYTLGKGYNYFKSVSKSVFINDIQLSKGSSFAQTKMTGNPFFLRIDYFFIEEQEKDKNSLLNILEAKTPSLAKIYRTQLGELTKNNDFRLFETNATSKPDQYYQCVGAIVQSLEIISEYFKSAGNIYIKKDIEQNELDKNHKIEVENIIHAQKLKYITYKTELTILQNISEQSFNKLSAKFNTIYSSVQKRRLNEIELLKKEKKSKIDALSHINFIKNKSIIINKYDNLISLKTIQGDTELNNLESKFKSDNETEIIEYENKINDLKKKIEVIDYKIENIYSNLETMLPLKPQLLESDYTSLLDIAYEAMNTAFSRVKMPKYDRSGIVGIIR